MEHRWGRREDCQLLVLIEAVAHARLSAHIQNLSLSGAFLRISIGEDLPPTVIVHLPPPDAAAYVPHQVIAHIVRRTREGIGLEWVCFAPQVIRLHFAAAAPEPQTARVLQVIVQGQPLRLEPPSS